MSINQLNTLFMDFMQFYAHFFLFLHSQKLIMQELYSTLFELAIAFS
jgi:hypothetical protein